MADKEDSLTKLLRERKERGEAYMQPGGYKPGMTDRGPNVRALAAEIERRLAKPPDSLASNIDAAMKKRRAQ